MTNTIIYNYPNNKKFNTHRLFNEIKASSLPPVLQEPKIFNNKLQIEFSNTLNGNISILDIIIQNHSGLPSRTDKTLQEKREIVFSDLVDLAHNHPVLKIDNELLQTGENIITEYLTSIDNWINAWKRDGNHLVLISKIIKDAESGKPFEKFLNTIIDTNLNVTYQFLISQIPTTPYI